MSDFTRKHNTEVIDDKKYEFGIDGDTYYDEKEYGVKLKGSKDNITVLARKKYVDNEIATLKKYVDDENQKQDVKIDKNTADIVDLSSRVTVNETDIDNLQKEYEQLNTDVSALNLWKSNLTEKNVDFTPLPLDDTKFTGTLGYTIRQGIIYINGMLTPVTYTANSVALLTKIPTELIPKVEISGIASTYLIGSSINNSSAVSMEIYINSSGDMNFRGGTDLTNKHRIGVSGSYPIL